MDKVVMYVEGDKQFRECVSCGFKDEMRLSYPGRELDTRVNRSREEREGQVQPVKIIEP
jgi:Zn ribbon nucleic-acid-binding protein